MSTQSTQPVPDDALRRAMEIHRRLEKEYGLDFLNLREDLVSRAEAEDAAATQTPPQKPREG